jgi:hypothetical protein
LSFKSNKYEKTLIMAKPALPVFAPLNPAGIPNLRRRGLYTLSETRFQPQLCYLTYIF